MAERTRGEEAAGVLTTRGAQEHRVVFGYLVSSGAPGITFQTLCYNLPKTSRAPNPSTGVASPAESP